MSSSVDRVEVFSQIQRRRRWSVDQKLAILAETGQPGMSISYVARRHGISPSLVFGWRRRMSEGGKEAVRADDDGCGSQLDSTNGSFSSRQDQQQRTIPAVGSPAQRYSPPPFRPWRGR